jgi:hypothetical protein
MSITPRLFHQRILRSYRGWRSAGLSRIEAARAALLIAFSTPDSIIGTQDDPYLRRWYIVPRNRFFNIYLHHFMRSDDDRALHDHPWWNISILLKNNYREHLQDGSFRDKTAPGIVLRTASFAHRIELINGPAWTLFITGPKIREWGFLCPQGWRHWRDFTAGPHGETIGKGCGE